MDNKALLIVDVLNAVFKLPVPVWEPERFLDNVMTLLRAAREAGNSPIFVQHNGPDGTPFARGSPGWRIHPRVTPQEGEVVVEKRFPDSFQQTELESILQSRSVRQLVICGFATEGCIDTTVRSAFSRGYCVVLASDAHTTTRNALLEADQVVAHHNLILKRFAAVEPTSNIRWGAA